MKMNYMLGGFLVVSLIALGGILWAMQNTCGQDEKLGYPTQSEALMLGLSELTGSEVTPEQADRWTLGTIGAGNRTYFIMAIPFPDRNPQEQYSFVALVEKERGRYTFYKATADVALDPKVSAASATLPDASWFFFDNVAGNYVAVGKILREGSVAVADGVLLESNEDHLFIAIKSGAQPKIVIEPPTNLD